VEESDQREWKRVSEESGRECSQQTLVFELRVESLQVNIPPGQPNYIGLKVEKSSKRYGL
jgi:hypothetical protein